jgi:DNA-binding transcriptional LysR family regulator
MLAGMTHSLIPAALRYIDQVARSGSIQAAAKELHIAASAVNRQILQIEDELGVPLFERLPRGMRLTVAGEALVAMTREWRGDERRAVAQIRSLQGVHQGHVRMMAMDSHSTSFLPWLVESLADSHPLVSLSVDLASPDEATAELLAGRADVAAIFNLPPRRELLALWRAELPFGCVVAPGHALARQTSVSLQEAAAHPVALQSRSLAIRRYLEAQYGWLFSEAQVRFETNSLQLVKRLARSGRYLAITSELDAAPELIDGSLCFRPVRDQGAEPQTISIAVTGGKAVGPIVKLVADRATQAVQRCLQAVRAAGAGAPV